MKKQPKNYHRKLSGFTLVELIVVITILVILGTIAFISLSGFSGNARDSSRVSDLANLSKSLEVANIRLGSYPAPDNHFFVAYSGGALWEQGTIGTTVTNIIKAGGVSLSKKPTDPLDTTKEYDYSRLAYGKAYQIKADYEGDSVSFRNIPLVEQTYATSGDPQISYIEGNYNGVVAKTQTGGNTYVIAIPSLFINTSTGVVSLDTTTQTGFYILGQTNSGGTSFQPKLVYASGALLSSTDSTGTLALAQDIANAYSGTTLASAPQIQSYVTALATNNTEALSSLGEDIVTTTFQGILAVTMPVVIVPQIGWTVSGGGDCTAVDNTLGSDGNNSTCLDNRVYTMQGVGATHSRIYNLLKIAGYWWFNQNLAYPLDISHYRGDGVWSSTDSQYYSCPGNSNGSSIVNCNSVSTLGYLYQWSAAGVWTSNDNQSARTQGICPIGWGLPTKADFISSTDSYWPTNDETLAGNTIGWIRSLAGQRDYNGIFQGRTTQEFIWTTSIYTAPWAEYFYTGEIRSMRTSSLPNSTGVSVRCIKN